MFRRGGAGACSGLQGAGGGGRMGAEGKRRMDTDQAKDDGVANRTMWRARTLRSWRDNGSGASLWGGVFLLVLGAVWLPATRNQDVRVFDAGIALMVVGDKVFLLGELLYGAYHLLSLGLAAGADARTDLLVVEGVEGIVGKDFQYLFG